jgi:Ca2+-binding EF-hand superfamily protein
LFQLADKNGNGALDKQELRTLLLRTNRGLSDVGLDWLSEAELGMALSTYDQDGSGDISFDEFVQMATDGMLLEGKLQEYRAAFHAMDTTGNGTIAGCEIEALFERMGQPLTRGKLWKIMDQYDQDANGQIDFDEFLMMFQDDLLDVREILDYIKLNPARQSEEATHEWPRGNQLVQWTPGQVLTVFSEEEFDQILAANPDRLVCIQASLTWCRPCIGFEPTYDRFAKNYPDVIFIKFYGNSNELTKYLFEERLHTAQTPYFTFFRQGGRLHGHYGANNEKLETYLQQHVSHAENPAAELNPFKRRVWRAKLGLK